MGPVVWVHPSLTELDPTAEDDGRTIVTDGGEFVIGDAPGGGAVTPEAVRDAGRWEVVVSGVPAEAVTNEAGDDWLYTWTEV